MLFRAKSASEAAQTSGPTGPRRWRRNSVGALVAVLALGFGSASVAGAHGVSARPVTSQNMAAASHIVGVGEDHSKRFNSTFRQGNVAVNGGTLHYYLGGSGPVLVLLHGWPETSWIWHNVAPDLAKTHTVVAFDLPGLGKSSIPTSGYDADTTARRIHDGVHALGFSNISILAHDVGALVAYPYALDFPSEVNRMAVMEAPLNGFGLEQAYGLSFHFLLNAAPKPIPENIIDNGDVSTYLGMLFNGAHHPEAIDQQVYFNAYSSPANRETGYNYYRAYTTNAAFNVAHAANKITLPVMAMGAQYVFGPAVAASFSQVASDVRQVVVPDSGHFIPEENPTFLTQCSNLFFGPAGVTPPAGLEGCGA
ncbi:MAG: alpha/beta hydrolase [Jatrophihabitantaceae bacterium]